MLPIDPKILEWLKDLSPFHIGIIGLLFWGWWRAGTYERTLRRLESWLEKKDKEVEFKEKELKVVEKEKDDVVKLLHDVEIQLTKSEATNHNLEGMVSKMNKNIEDLEKEVTELSVQVQSMTEILGKKNNRISTLKVKLAATEKERDHWRDEAEAAQGIIANVANSGGETLGE